MLTGEGGCLSTLLRCHLPQNRLKGPTDSMYSCTQWPGPSSSAQCKHVAHSSICSSILPWQTLAQARVLALSPSLPAQSVLQTQSEGNGRLRSNHGKLPSLQISVWPQQVNSSRAQPRTCVTFQGGWLVFVWSLYRWCPFEFQC